MSYKHCGRAPKISFSFIKAPPCPKMFCLRERKTVQSEPKINPRETAKYPHETEIHVIFSVKNYLRTKAKKNKIN